MRVITVDVTSCVQAENNKCSAVAMWMVTPRDMQCLRPGLACLAGSGWVWLRTALYNSNSGDEIHEVNGWPEGKSHGLAES